MEQLKQYFKMVMVGLSAAMFILLGAGPAIDVMGKATLSGFKTVFDGEGIGFPRFLCFLMLVVPILVVIKQFVAVSALNTIKDKFEMICFGVAIFLFVIFACALPTGVKPAVGAYLYLAFSIAGIAASFLVNGKKEEKK